MAFRLLALAGTLALSNIRMVSDTRPRSRASCTAATSVPRNRPFAPARPRLRTEPGDPYMRQTRKGNNGDFCLILHIGVNVESESVHIQIATPVPKHYLSRVPGHLCDCKALMWGMLATGAFPSGWKIRTGTCTARNFAARGEPHIWPRQPHNTDDAGLAPAAGQSGASVSDHETALWQL